MPKQAASKERASPAPAKGAAAKAPAKGAAAPAKGTSKAPAKGAGKTIKKDKKAVSWRVNFPLYEKRPKNFSVGNDVQPKRDLTRFVRWPKYIRVQRQKRILLERLKVPPTLNQFRKTFNRANAVTLFKFLHKYRPEEKKAKQQRLQKLAELKAKGENIESFKKPIQLTHGIRSITQLVESKEAKLVVIANDVDPVEVVVWLPTLCRKLDIPYVIVKSKSRLGKLVHKKTAAVVAITDTRKEDRTDLANLVTSAREQFNDNADARKQWGGQKLGPKARARIAKHKKVLAKENKLRSKSVAR